MQNEPLEEYKLKLEDLNKIEKNNNLFTPINCPSCGAGVPADNININNNIGKCGNCNVVFSFEKEISELTGPQNRKDEVIRPEGVEVFRYDNELDFTLQQPVSPMEAVGMTLFMVAAPISLILHYKEGVSLVWAIGFTIVFLYFLFSMIFRSSYKLFINLDSNYLNVRYRPSNLQKDKKYLLSEIDQLYVKAVGGSASLYMIVNGVEGQKHVSITPMMVGKSKVRFLEQEIEKHLKIKDRQVPEES